MAYKVFSEKAIQNRVNLILEKREEVLAHIDDYHVYIGKGNSKTGEYCRTVSLAPVIDCTCFCPGCYDIQNVCWRPEVQLKRAINSAIHKTDPERYWWEINMKIKAEFIRELRLNEGGDLTDEDFYFTQDLAKDNLTCDIMYFTKNHHGQAKYIDECGFGQIYMNLHPLLSAWKDREMYNPYNLPESHILFPDGSCTLPDFTLCYHCSDNCSECHYHKECGNKEKSGCWGFQAGDKVLLKAH